MVSDVKFCLQVPQAYVTDDTELGKWIEAADGYIDASLVRYTTVPLTTVPTHIKWISAQLAAARYREARNETRDTGLYMRQIAEGYLQKYIQATFITPKNTLLSAATDFTVSS